MKLRFFLARFFKRYRIAYYDGGCIHSPYTCAECQ